MGDCVWYRFVTVRGLRLEKAMVLNYVEKRARESDREPESCGDVRSSQLIGGN